MTNKFSNVYEISFFSLLSMVIAIVAIVIILSAIGFFSDPQGYCKITEGEVGICKKIKRKSCKNQKGEFFLKSKDCKPTVLF
jgi:hypothetical protein